MDRFCTAVVVNEFIYTTASLLLKARGRNWNVWRSHVFLLAFQFGSGPEPVLLRLGRLQLGHGPRIELCTGQHSPGNLRKMEENQLLLLIQLLS